MLEKDIQRQIEDWLKYQENQGKLVYVRQNTGALPTAKGGFIRFGKVGGPDLMIYLPDGKCLHLEVKNESGKMSDGQKLYKARIEKLGHRYEVARSLEEVQELLK